MPRLDIADAIYLGGAAVDRVYKGDSLLWQAEETPPVGIVDQANLYDQWLAADASGVGEGNQTPSWIGRVNGVEASQAMSARWPRYFGGVGGGLPGLLFAGSLLNTPRFPSPVKLSVYAKVYFSTAVSGTQTIVCHDEGGNARSWHCGVNATRASRFVNFNNGVGGTTAEVVGTVPTSTWQIVQGFRNADDVTKGGPMYSANGSETSAEATAVNVLTSDLYMSIGGRGGYSELLNAYITELRVYTAYHDEATRALVRAEMA